MNPNELRSLQEAYLEVVDGQQLDEAMSSYDRNRKRAAQRAAERNAARAAGKTGVVPGVGYVSPRKERETYTDEKGTVRHKSGAKMEDVEYVDEDSRRMSNKQHTQRVRSNIKSFGSNYTPPSNYDPDANRGKGEVLTRKQMEKKRRKALRKEEVSVYDIVLSHLLDEGYADTIESAEGIMINMSEEWRDSIVESKS